MLHAKDSLGGSRSSCFMRETGKDSPLSSSSKWWTRTSAGITRSASRFPWAHAVPFNTGKASALKCKPVQEIRRTPHGSIWRRRQQFIAPIPSIKLRLMHLVLQASWRSIFLTERGRSPSNSKRTDHELISASHDTHCYLVVIAD